MTEWTGPEEVLDTRARRGRDPDRPPPQELPPVDLGTTPPGTGPTGGGPPGAAGAQTGGESGGQPAGTTPGRPWLTRVLLAACAATFVIGLVIGTTTGEARRDAAAAASAVEDARVAAVVLGLDGTGRDGVRRLSVSLRNLGDRDLTLVSLYPDGWVVAEDGRQNVRLPAGQWASVSVLAHAACDTPVPEAMIARVSTGERQRVLTLPLPPGDNPLAWARQETCTLVPADLFVGSVQVRNATPSGLRVELVLRGGSTPSTVVTGVSSRTPGFTVTADEGIPVTVRGGGVTSHPVTVRWRVTDCEQAAQLGSVDIALEVAAPAGSSSVSVQSLDPRVTAGLARYALEQCGSPT